MSQFLEAKKIDAADALREYRDQFWIPKTTSGDPWIYFSGNSLGLQPKATQSYLSQELEDWKNLGVAGHFEASRPWVSYHQQTKKGLMHLVGAREDEVVAMNSLTANLHHLMVSFYQPTKQRKKVLMLSTAFPSDKYAVASQISFHGLDPDTSLVFVSPKPGSHIIEEDQILEIIDDHADELALVLIEGVSYLTGQKFDLKPIAQKAHEVGAIIGADLAHGIGNVAWKLHDEEVDFAVWCSYKYLNGGPGCVAGAFVHEKHAKDFDLPLFAGWWGTQASERFAMKDTFEPMKGINRWQMSNVPILTSACLLASLEIFQEASIQTLEAKSKKLTQYLESLILEHLEHKVDILTPRDPSRRGCQLSLVVKGGDKSVHDALIQKGVACDWRSPNVIRVAPVPLYNTFQEVHNFVHVLKEVL